jgi:hypothetical protein
VINAALGLMPTSHARTALGSQIAKVFGPLFAQSPDCYGASRLVSRKRNACDNASAASVDSYRPPIETGVAAAQNRSAGVAKIQTA